MSEEQPKICPNCSRENLFDASICGYCRHDLRDVEPRLSIEPNMLVVALGVTFRAIFNFIASPAGRKTIVVLLVLGACSYEIMGYVWFCELAGFRIIGKHVLNLRFGRVVTYCY